LIRHEPLYMAQAINQTSSSSGRHSESRKRNIERVKAYLSMSTT
jgi:hypothetical protein